MKRDLRFVLFSLLFVIVFAIASFAQEMTGSIEITAKDETGAVVPGVAMTVVSTGGTAGYKRTVTTNDEGFVLIRAEGMAFRVLKEFDHHAPSRLSISFLTPKTRVSTFSKAYLLTLPQQQVP